MNRKGVNSVKIKVFSEWSNEELEKKVNAFLSENDVNVIEMQFRAKTFYFAVMIRYDDWGAGR